MSLFAEKWQAAMREVMRDMVDDRSQTERIRVFMAHKQADEDAAYERFMRSNMRPRTAQHGAVFVSVRGVLWHVAPLEHADGALFLTLCRKRITAAGAVVFERFAATRMLCPDCLDEYRNERDVLLNIVTSERATTINVNRSKGV